MVNFTCPVVFDKPLDPKPFFENGNYNIKIHDVGWLICGIMTLVATIASIWLIWKHLSYYTCPQQQRHIVRLLVMVPVYAIVSYMSYLFYHDALYYQTIRDCYEAVLVTSFFYLILAYTGDTTAEQHAVFRNLNFEKWVFPLGTWSYKPEGLHFLWIMKISVLQYAIIRPLCTFAAVGLEYFGFYCLHSWMPWFGHVWCAILISISVTVAMFCLIQLYMPIRELVDPYKPVLKFLAVKTIVFLTFWQDTLLSFLVSFNVIKETEYFTADQIQAGINALLQCFWMMLFGFIHIKAFSYLPYLPADEKRTTMRGRALLNSLDFRDWFWEMKESTRYMAARSKGKQYTLAEDLRANRRQHLLQVFGTERNANLEHEISLEKQNMPSFFRPRTNANSSNLTSSADAYTTPPPKRTSRELRDAPRQAELDKLVAELDMDSFYEGDKEDEDRSLLKDRSSWMTELRPSLDKHESTPQYQSARQIHLADVPTLGYNYADAARSATSASPVGVAAYGIPGWSDYNAVEQAYEQPATHQRPVVQHQALADQSSATERLQRRSSVAARWWRSRTDRVSSSAPRQDYGEPLTDRQDVSVDMTPPRMCYVAGGSWGRSSVQVSPQAKTLTDQYSNTCDGDIHESPMPATASFIPHSDSPLSRLMPTPRGSSLVHKGDYVEQWPSSSDMQKSWSSPAMLVVQPEMAARHPSITPSVVTSHRPQSQNLSHRGPLSVSPSQDGPATGITANLLPAIGPKGKVVSLILPSPLSPARYPCGQVDGTSRVGLFDTPPPSSAPTRPEAVSPVANTTTASSLKWSLPPKSPKRESVALPRQSKAVIMPGALSLSQVRAQEASGANAGAQGREQTDAYEKAAMEQKRMLVEEQRRASVVQQQKQQHAIYSPRRSQPSASPTKAAEQARPVLPKPSHILFTVSGGDQSPPSSLIPGRMPVTAQNAPRHEAPASNGPVPASIGRSVGDTTVFEVGSIVPRHAVFHASGAPLKGYYSQIYQEHRRTTQTQQSEIPSSRPQQQHPYALYHQDRTTHLAGHRLPAQRQQPIPEQGQHRQQGAYPTVRQEQYLPLRETQRDLLPRQGRQLPQMQQQQQYPQPPSMSNNRPYHRF